MKNYFATVLLLSCLLMLNSCFVNRTTVGDGPRGRVDAVKFDHAKQMYLLWGLIPLKHTQPKLPVDCGYQVKTCFSFWDGLVTGITAGIFGMRSQKVLVYRNGPCDPAIRRMEHKLEKKEMKGQSEQGK